MKKLMLLLLAGGLLTVSSCSKSGSVGPQGPQGPTGNANVIGEDAFTVTNWTATANGWMATFSDPNLTNSVYNYGSFQLYKYYSSGWTNLPDIDGYLTTAFNFRPGFFDIYVYNTDNSTAAVPNPGSVTFRAVIIPSSYKQAYPNTNWTNYTETMKAVKAAKAQGLK